MSALEVLAPFQVFGDVDGEPLEDGYIYVGVKNLNPEVSPVQVYWDSALTIPAPQPIRTLGGYPSRMGTPSRMYVDADSYSISVKNKNGTFIYSLLDSASLQASANVIGGVQVVDSISDLRALAKDSPSKNAFVAGYYVPGDGGGGNYYYDSADTTSADNGGTIIVATDGGRWKLTATETVSVKQFGAKGDFNVPTETGTDDTAFIQAALDYVNSITGGVLYFPEGQYKITAALGYSNNPIEIIGDGIDQTLIIQTTAAANAFDFVHTDVPPWVDGVLGHGGRLYSTIIRDLSIVTTKQAGRAINVSIPASTQNNTWVRLTRVAIKSLLYVTVGFQYGLFCHNVNGTKLDEFYFMGDAGNTSVDAAAPFYSQTAIVLEGDNAFGFISHYWRGVTVYAANRAVHITNHYEGIYLQQFEFGGVGEGIVIDPTTFTNFHAENGHIDFKAQGIFAKNVSGLRLVNVDLLKHGQSPGAHTVVGPNVHIELCNGASIIGGRCWSFTGVGNCNGIEIVDSIEFAIEGVDIKDMANTNTGITVSNGSKGVISGNVIKNVVAGIAVSAASNEIVIADNVISELVGTPGTRFGIVVSSPATNITIEGNSGITDVDLAIANNSTGNYIYHNTGGGAQYSTFADGDTTPLVDTTGARTFATANTLATSITTFDGGYIGLEINVIALDANTTIVDSGAVVPILTKTGANIVMALNDTAKFVRGAGAWYEV